MVTFSNILLPPSSGPLFYLTMEGSTLLSNFGRPTK